MATAKKNGHGGSRPNTGGARPNSGPKKKPPTILTGLAKGDPRAFLIDIMDNEKLDVKERIAAAKAVAAMDRSKSNGGKPMGKKEQLKQDALALTKGEGCGAGDDDEDIPPAEEEEVFQAGRAPKLKRVA